MTTMSAQRRTLRRTASIRRWILDVSAHGLESLLPEPRDLPKGLPDQHREKHKEYIPLYHGTEGKQD